MRTKRTKLVLLFLISILFVFNSCKTVDDQNPHEGLLEFSISTELNKSSDNLKKALTNENISSVIVSINDAKGNTVKNMEEVELYNMNGSYISKPISLLVGDYKLTKFMLIDDNRNILYATPKEDSPKAYLVDSPLDIEFNITKDQVIKLKPEVISTIGCTAEDFGYVNFGFSIIETFDFLVSVFIYDSAIESFELTEANLLVMNDRVELYSENLEAITNTITLKDGFDLYELNIAKAGYSDYNQSFTNEELKPYFKDSENGPLIVILNKQDLTTLVLQPGAEEGKDAHLWSSRPDEQRGDYLYFESKAWSWSGQGDGSGFIRSLLEFDLSQIEQGAEITSAKLSLYGTNCDMPNGACVHSSLSGSNESILQRVTEPWDEFTVTWNNQPNTSSENEVLLAQSTDMNEDYIDIDVTQLVQDMINNKEAGFGFMLKLKTESQYRAMVFNSSDAGIPEKSPKLSVTYK